MRRSSARVRPTALSRDYAEKEREKPRMNTDRQVCVFASGFVQSPLSKQLAFLFAELFLWAMPKKKRRFQVAMGGA